MNQADLPEVGVAPPELGAALPEVVLEMSQTRLVMYAGATWDWHRIHYDTAYTASINLKAPVVDGQMFGGLFAQQVLAALDPRARITAMSLRFRSMVFAGETVRVTGEVSTVDPRGQGGRQLTATQQLHVDDRLCATARTTAALPEDPNTGCVPTDPIPEPGAG